MGLMGPIRLPISPRGLISPISDADRGYGSWSRVITFFSPDDQRRQPLRGVDADFDLAPLAVALFVERDVAYAVLMSQRQRDARDRVFQSRIRSGEKGHATSRVGEFFQDQLPLPIQSGPRAGPFFQNADAVDLHVGFFKKFTQLPIVVPGSVVLAVRDDQDRPLVVAALFDFFDAQISGVIKGRLAVRLGQREPVEDAPPVRNLGQQRSALVEADKEKIVLIMAGVDEGFDRFAGA